MEVTGNSVASFNFSCEYFALHLRSRIKQYISTEEDKNGRICQIEIDREGN